MLSYLLIGIIISTVAYYIARKYYLRAIDEINFCKEKEQKEIEGKIEELNKITQLSHIDSNKFMN